MAGKPEWDGNGKVEQDRQEEDHAEHCCAVDGVGVVAFLAVVPPRLTQTLTAPDSKQNGGSFHFSPRV
jgi:hypothetical protein